MTLKQEYKSEISRLGLITDKNYNIQPRAINCSNPGLINYIVNYRDIPTDKIKVCFSRMGNNYHVFNKDAPDYKSENKRWYKDFASAIKDLKTRINLI